MLILLTDTVVGTNSASLIVTLVVAGANLVLPSKVRITISSGPSMVKTPFSSVVYTSSPLPFTTTTSSPAKAFPFTSLKVATTLSVPAELISK